MKGERERSKKNDHFWDILEQAKRFPVSVWGVSGGVWGVEKTMFGVKLTVGVYNAFSCVGWWVYCLVGGGVWSGVVELGIGGWCFIV